MRHVELRSLLAGAALAIGGRALAGRLMLAKSRRDAVALNGGDPAPLLSNYAPDAVLRFNDGNHRWRGEHSGKAAIGRFLANFIAAGVRGEVTELYFGGPPWRMTVLARFDDHAEDEAGRRIYANRMVLVMRSRWGRIVHHEDFYEDTGKIEELEASLVERSIPVAK